EAEVARLCRYAAGEVWPHLTLWLDLPPAVAAARLAARGAADRLEGEGLAFQERLVASFRRLAAAEPDRWARIDAAGSEAEVAARIWEAVRRRFPELAGP
ncbi:MAG: dTMP kinase, partial [Nitrospirae bacterium]